MATVVQNYYGLVIARRREENARRTLDEARSFLELTQKQERGGEVARADVIKAQLQHQQRQRDLMDAETNTRKARLALGVILFADMTQPFNVNDDARPDSTLPSLEEVRIQAVQNSPEGRAAEAGLREAETNVVAARAPLHSQAFSITFSASMRMFLASAARTIGRTLARLCRVP